MRALAVDVERCTGCHACEEACAETWFRVRDRRKSAIRVGGPRENGRYTLLTCTQCGDCIDICPTAAISRRPNGVVRIDKDLCVGCMACVGFCDILAMRMHPAEFYPYKCVACGNCVKVCETQALRIEDVENVPSSETEKWAERERR